VTLAIIPCRAGSRGVIGKNKRLVAGLPLWKWSLRAAARASTVERVIVTSDDTEILMHASGAGCVPVLRPDALATDEAPLDSALLHALDACAVQNEEIVVVLQPTVPVRPWDLIDQCVRALDFFASAKSLITVNPAHFVWAESGELLNGPRVNRQEMTSKYFHEDGSVFAVRARDFRKYSARVIPPVILYAAPKTIDIDTEQDLRIAEALLSVRESGAA